MKKLIFLLAILALCLCGCGDKDKEAARIEVIDGVQYVASTTGGNHYIAYKATDKTRTEYKIQDAVNGIAVTEIGAEAFKGCTNLKSITIGMNITSVGQSAFANCGALESADILGNPVNGLTLGSRAFECCYNLSRVNIGAGVFEINYDSFDSCDKLRVFSVDDANPYYKDNDANLYTKDGTTLVRYAIGKMDRVFEVPKGVTTIAPSAFADADNLFEVVVENDVTTIGSYAFLSCYNLVKVTLGSGVSSVGGYAFSLCDMLTVYCEAMEKPSGWHEGWRDNSCDVVWGMLQ